MLFPKKKPPPASAKGADRGRFFFLP